MGHPFPNQNPSSIFQPSNNNNPNPKSYNYKEYKGSRTGTTIPDHKPPKHSTCGLGDQVLFSQDPRAVAQSQTPHYVEVVCITI